MPTLHGYNLKIYLKNLNLNVHCGLRNLMILCCDEPCFAVRVVLWMVFQCLCSKAESAAFFDNCSTNKLPIGAVEILLSRTRCAIIFFLTPNIITTRNRSRLYLQTRVKTHPVIGYRSFRAHYNK